MGILWVKITESTAATVTLTMDRLASETIHRHAISKLGPIVQKGKMGWLNSKDHTAFPMTCKIALLMMANCVTTHKVILGATFWTTRTVVSLKMELAAIKHLVGTATWMYSPTAISTNRLTSGEFTVGRMMDLTALKVEFPSAIH